MSNSLAEGFVRVTYSGPNGPHHQILPVNYAGTPTPGVMPDFTTKDAATISMSTGMASYLAEFRKWFNDDTLIGLVEAYTVDPDTEERTFIWGYDAGLLGADGGANVALSMCTLSFKTIAGGLLKIVFMESVKPVNTKIFPPYTVDSVQADMTAYITSDDSFIIGRDNAYAFASISQTVKTSDALRKRANLA